MTIPESFIPFIDIVLVVCLIVALIVGFKNGFLWQIIKILGFLAVLLLGWLLSPAMSELIKLFPRSWSPFNQTILSDVMYQQLNQITWFLVLVLVGFLLLLLLKPLAKAIKEIPIIKSINGILGAVLAILPYGICVIILSFILQSPIITNGVTIAEKSFFRYVNVVTDVGKTAISKAFSQNEAIQKLLYNQSALTEEDIKSLTDWLKTNDLSTEQVRNFLQGLGLDINDINKALGN